MLFLSALSIRHKAVELFIRLASCYSEAVTLLLEKGLDTGSPSEVTVPLSKAFRLIRPTSLLSLLINTAVFVTELFMELRKFKNNTALLLLTSY